MFQVSRPYLVFCPDPKIFIVNCEQNVVKLRKNGGKCIEKCNFYTKYFDKIKCYADRPYLVFSDLKHTYIFIWPYDYPNIISFRSTAELENFQNHILMYTSKRFAYSPPVYRARNLLAALDYNEHISRGSRINRDGSQRYVPPVSYKCE